MRWTWLEVRLASLRQLLKSENEYGMHDRPQKCQPRNSDRIYVHDSEMKSEGYGRL